MALTIGIKVQMHSKSKSIDMIYILNDGASKLKLKLSVGAECGNLHPGLSNILSSTASTIYHYLA